MPAKLAHHLGPIEPGSIQRVRIPHSGPENVRAREVRGRVYHGPGIVRVERIEGL